MLIFVSEVNPRIQYVFDFVFKDVLKIDYELTANKDFFRASDSDLKWAYTNDVMNCLSLPTSRFLLESNIQEQDIEKVEFEDLVGLFKVENSSEIPFDLFASMFYLISRYEEYLPCVKDSHGRYAAYQSAAYEYGFMETAMVNRYVLWLMNWLNANFTSLDLKLGKPKALVSFDLDHPFYSKDVSLDKWLIRSFKEGSFFKEKDKYDTYDFIFENIVGLPSIFFLLCPKSQSDMDNFNKRESENFKDLIQSIRLKSKIGIHPSYYSEERGLLNDEIQWLSSQHGSNIKSSRFHYLRYDIETSFVNLLKEGIRNDFSMAYGDHAGFRTSTSFPYYWFDLKKNRKTSLRIFTPCIMDSVFKYGYQQDFDKKSMELIREVRNYGGVYVPIFHNDILAEDDWQTEFKDMIKLLKDEL